MLRPASKTIKILMFDRSRQKVVIEKIVDQFDIFFPGIYSSTCNNYQWVYLRCWFFWLWQQIFAGVASTSLRPVQICLMLVSRTTESCTMHIYFGRNLEGGWIEVEGSKLFYCTANIYFVHILSTKLIFLCYICRVLTTS